MFMLVVGGFDQEPERKTFECLRCAHIEHPLGPAPPVGDTQRSARPSPHRDRTR